MIIQGDALSVQKRIPDKTIHSGVSSPPYYSPGDGLRDYKIPQINWPDGWTGDLGKEPTPQLYAEHLTLILHETKRILRDDGTLWLNLGDSRAGSGRGPSGKTGCIQNQEERQNFVGKHQKIPPGFKRKDIFGIPFTVGEYLRADGWYWRDIIPWYKHNGMPGSYKDRPVSTIEYVLILTKTPHNYYDYVVVMQKSSESYLKDKRPKGVLRQRVNPNTKYNRETSQFKKQDETGNSTYTGFNNRYAETGGFGDKRLLRSSDFFFKSFQGMWLDEEGDPLAIILNPKPFKGHHFATFPPALPLLCMSASTSEKGVCPQCGAPWIRIGEKVFIPQQDVSEEKGIRCANNQKPLDPNDNRNG